MRKGLLPAKLINLIILVVLSIIIFSLIFITMITLSIQISIDMVFKPIYKPLSSQSLAFSLFSSELGTKLEQYLRTNSTELKEELESTISSFVMFYKIVIGDKILGNSFLPSDQKYSSYLLTDENNKINIEVST